MVKAIIFDCFGVLIADGLDAVLLRLDTVDPSVHEFVRETIRLSNRGLLPPEEAHQQIAERLGIPVSEWQQNIRSGEIRHPQVVALIKELRGRYKTAMLSNISRESLAQRFSVAELDELFDVVVVSGDEGYLKPDPEVYELTAERLGVEPSECVFIDDREAYAEGAKGVGMQAIWYQSFAQMKRELDALLT